MNYFFSYVKLCYATGIGAWLKPLVGDWQSNKIEIEGCITLFDTKYRRNVSRYICDQVCIGTRLRRRSVFSCVMRMITFQLHTITKNAFQRNWFSRTLKCSTVPNSHCFDYYALTYILQWPFVENARSSNMILFVIIPKAIYVKSKSFSFH